MKIQKTKTNYNGFKNNFLQYKNIHKTKKQTHLEYTKSMNIKKMY